MPGQAILAIAAYLGDDDAVDHAFADFAARYADQNEKDHAAFLAAIKQGRLKAEPSAGDEGVRRRR